MMSQSVHSCSALSVELINFKPIDHTSAVADGRIGGGLDFSDILYQKWVEDEVGRIAIPKLGRSREQLDLWPERNLNRRSLRPLPELEMRIAAEFDKWLSADASAIERREFLSNPDWKLPTDSLEEDWYE
ncbi:MAG: hypothetical protein ABL949_04375 [Fimbriimonadaceae bacterium]